MLRTISSSEPITLIHGRFQPPHEGHFNLIKNAPTNKVIVSIDNRNPDSENPYSYHFRKEILKDNLPDIDLDIISHNTTDCKTTLDYLSKIYDGVKSYNIKHVLFGPDILKEVKDFWISKDIKVHILKNRLPIISGTEIRKRNISIITNFGCNRNCWYCIWKKHTLKNHPQMTYWNKLKMFLTEHDHKNKVSISGGGDPLYKFNQNKSWWEYLFSITNQNIDIHTRVKMYNNEFWKNINKVAFSSDYIHEDKNFLNYLKSLTKVRIVHVITPLDRKKTIESLISFTSKNDMELTFKRLIGFGNDGNFDYLKDQFPNQFFLDKGDYNIYYMPDNTIRTKFLF